MLIAGAVPSIIVVILLLGLAILPTVTVVWLASLMSRSSGERRTGLVFGILGAVAPYAVLCAHHDSPPTWFPQSDFAVFVCAITIGSILAALGVTCGVRGRRFLGRVLPCRQHRPPAH